MGQREGVMDVHLLFGLLFLFSSFLCDLVDAKECTNIPTQLSSHTFRSKLLSSNNESLKEEVLSHYHLTPTDEAQWMDMLPRKFLAERRGSSQEEFSWAMLYRSFMSSDDLSFPQQGVNFLKDVSLHDVRLDPHSFYGRAQQTNLEYLLLLDVDRLVWSFRNLAGLSAPGTPYGGWEGPDVELRGHFVGHYLSASALMWGSTHNDTLYKKMSTVVDVLNECQQKMGTGYLSAFPSEFFDRFEAIQSVWAPYYTIHKIMAGLLDQYSIADNKKALQMLVWTAEYFGNRVKNVILKYTIERHWMSLNEETGGMNDVLYRLYTVTGDKKHLALAHLFDKPCFLGLLAVQADSLSGFHTNTHIPVVLGVQRRYEITGDELYKELTTFFMSIVNSSHAYATGGTSVSEFWSDPKRLADTLTTENEESCTTYNMLKVSRNLFRWTKEMAYADYYERALTNGVLSIQRGTEPGIMIYMLPQGPGQSKARSYHGWGTKNDSFWCCYGTGIESFSKLGDSIYFEEKGNVPGLFIIQYVSSSFNWRSVGLLVKQQLKPFSSLNPVLQISFRFTSNKTTGQQSTLHLRIPSWTSGAKATLNGKNLAVPVPGNFLSITNTWKADALSLEFPMDIRTEPIKDDRPEYATLQAILFGPYLLAGMTNGDWDLSSGGLSVSDWIAAVPAENGPQLASITQAFNSTTLVLTSSNGSLSMQEWPEHGTDPSVHATFRISPVDNGDAPPATRDGLLGRKVTVEPFDLPGSAVVGQKGEALAVGMPGLAAIFKVVDGLDGGRNTVSFELVVEAGCFFYTDTGGSRKIVGAACRGNESAGGGGVEFEEASSFVLAPPTREYNAVSFAAKGRRRNFLLEPLWSLKDESYTLYFNVGA